MINKALEISCRKLANDKHEEYVERTKTQLENYGKV